MKEWVVVGGGVSGLTTAIVLAERGYRVTVKTKKRLGDASVIAGAVWEPYKTAASARSVRWARRSYEVFEELARDSASGVRMAVLFERTGEEPWWREVVRGYRWLGHGFEAIVPIIETPIYMPYLEARLSAQARVVIEDVAVLSAGMINCAGLGARGLVDDPALIPVRGQVVRVENPGIERCTIDDEVGPGAMTYIIPRRDGCVLGGTFEEGEEGDRVEPAVIEAILARAAAIEPALARARVLATAAGFRPYRFEPRVERAGSVVHNYGHGGAGFTLSWGCAEEVADLI